MDNKNYRNLKNLEPRAMKRLESSKEFLEYLNEMKDPINYIKRRVRDYRRYSTSKIPKRLKFHVFGSLLFGIFLPLLNLTPIPYSLPTSWYEKFPNGAFEIILLILTVIFLLLTLINIFKITNSSQTNYNLRKIAWIKGEVHNEKNDKLEKILTQYGKYLDGVFFENREEETKNIEISFNYFFYCFFRIR